MIRYLLPVTLMPLLASCVAPSTPAPVAPPPVARPAPAPSPAPAQLADRYRGDWSVDELTPGEWVIELPSVARFIGSDGARLAAMSCVDGQLRLGRSGILPQDIRAVFRIRASAGERELGVQRADQSMRWIETALPASDLLWDSILYSRGRFVIETTMQAPLILPTRPALQRVVEECRG